VALEGLRRHDEADAAFTAAQGRAAAVPAAARLRLRWVYGFAVSGRLPAKARAAFEEVLAEQPRHPQALYGRAMLLADRGRLDEALAAFNHAVEAAPGFVEARRFRGVLLARQGNFEAASQDINWCLEREPDVGATLYAGACVAARAVERCADAAAAKQTADQAFVLLQRAFARGYGLDKAASDPDLAGVRRYPEFQRLLQNHAMVVHGGKESS
jgi:tetratricopeptide (TPR) repeat protein